MENADPIFRKTLETALNGALLHLENLERNAVATSVDLHTLRKRLGKPLPGEGMPPEQVVIELVNDVEGGILGSAGGRFFGWVIGGSLPAALAADWLTSAWDQNAVLFASGPAAAVVEEIVGSWLKEILGLPAHASFALVTGCQMGHATCLAAARHALLEKRGWNVEEQGLYGAPPIRILSSDVRHGSFERAVSLLGLGRSQIVYLPVDSQDCLEAEVLEAALKADSSAPTIVLLQAGDINIGAYDPFESLIPIAKQHGAWVHIDGAFGLWAAASPQYKHLVAGVAAADSWATDGHKWLNVPFDSGYAFVANAEAHRASMSHRAAYLTHAVEARDEMDWNPEWSRRARGFSTYAALRQLGRNGIAALVERCSKHAHSLVTLIGREPGAEILWEPRINQGLVRFLDARPNASEEDHDRRTDQVIAAIVATGEAFFGGTTWRGRRAMRVSVCNWQTSDEDVQRSVRAVAKVLEFPSKTAEIQSDDPHSAPSRAASDGHQ
jgi:glutamate/tyrosine decarboxylase-like PLP-dependent enzyme